VIISHKYSFIFFCPVGNTASTSVQKSLLPYHDEPRIKNRHERNFEHKLNEPNPFGCPTDYRGFAGDNLVVHKDIWPHYFFDAISDLKGFDVELLKTYSRFAISRNPWDWLLGVYLKNLLPITAISRGSRMVSSAYVYPFIARQNFRSEKENYTAPKVLDTIAFLRGNGLHNQRSTYCNLEDNVLINTFLPFEDLDTSLLEFLDKRGLTDFKLPHEQNNYNLCSGRYQRHYDENSKKIVLEDFKEDISLFNYEF
jgi:hypothetical protein